MALIRALARGAAVLLGALQCVLAVEAAEIINAAFKLPRLELAPLVTRIESDRPQVTIEIPAAGASGSRQFTLVGEGGGPVYRWAVFTLRNPDPGQRALVLSLPRQAFAGSGLIWPRPLANRVLAVRSADGAPVTRLGATGLEAAAIQIAPAMTATFAVQLATERPDALALWQWAAFEQASQRRAVVSGAVLGVAGLLAFFVTALAVVRLRGVFWAGAALAWPAVAFIAMELGYLPGAIGWSSPLSGSADQVRAVVESLMLVGLAGLLASLVDLRRISQTVAGLAILLAGAALGLAVYGWFEPLIADGIARLAFGGLTVLGLVLLALLAWRDEPRALSSVPFWVVLALWTGVAAMSLLTDALGGAASVLLPGGLLAVLLALAVTLGSFAFGRGVVAKQVLQDAERRALALAGADQVVWDWQAARGRFFVGPELDRALGFDAGTVGARSLKGWLELLHPADRASYVAAVEAAEQRGRGTFSHEFRLRRGDGHYRWYRLRAKAISEPRGGLRLVGTLSDVTSLRRTEDRLLSDAVRDRVTGLPNRALFLDRLEREVRRAAAEDGPLLYVAVVGLDKFKSLNEGLGHEVGDSLLNIAGRRLASVVGPEDTLARLRGDQFAVIFRADKPSRDVDAFVASMRETLGRPISVRPREVSLTASFGVARLRHADMDPGDLLKDAETAMHEAKRKGRATIEHFRPDMRDERTRLLSLEQDLRRAVERNEIEVVFQPIMRLSTQELAGFEALMRWRRGGEVLVQPDGFISLAEELGIIRELGRHVLSEAVRQAGIWYRAFRPREPIYVAVNLSSAELLSAELVDEVRALLTREDVMPHALKIEITESIVMQNPELAEKVLHRFRQMGVGLACDDFGTGYSALANLRRLPFDMLKVDKAFLDNDDGDERGAILLESVMELAHDLGLTVVAEGVENQEQLQRLMSLGCDYGQGFFIGAPATAKQVIEALAGLPYGSGGRGGGRAGFWARFVGRRAPRPEVAAPERAPRAVEPVKPPPAAPDEPAPRLAEAIARPAPLPRAADRPPVVEIAAPVEEPIVEDAPAEIEAAEAGEPGAPADARQSPFVEEEEEEPVQPEEEEPVQPAEETPVEPADEAPAVVSEAREPEEEPGEAVAAIEPIPADTEDLRREEEALGDHELDLNEEEEAEIEAEPEAPATVEEQPPAISASKTRRQQLRRKFSRAARRKANR